MMEQLPALQIVLPLVAAPICLLLRKAGWVRVFAVGVSWLSLGIALSLLGRVLDEGAMNAQLMELALQNSELLIRDDSRDD